MEIMSEALVLGKAINNRKAVKTVQPHQKIRNWNMFCHLVRIPTEELLLLLN